MKRENVKKNIGIISAFADGKIIKILNERDEWVDPSTVCQFTGM